jgi:hypothetical protein
MCGHSVCPLYLVVTYYVDDNLYTNRMKYKKQIKYTLELIICVLIGVEIAIPPNPYIHTLIIVMTLYVCLKHDIPQKIENTLSKYIYND